VTGSALGLVADEVADIVDWQHHPFGNNYFPTVECGGAPYESNIRHCWAKQCTETQFPKADCFNGTVVTQHGPEEYKSNRMQACAITETKGDASWAARYWPFVVCLEENYNEGAVAASAACAMKAGLNETSLLSCFNGAVGDAAVIREAKATIDHPGTPYMTVAGAQVSATGDVVAAICKAYTGTPPAACQKIAKFRKEEMCV